MLDVASRNRENFLYNIYQMGKNSIERGNRDSWTPTPRRVIAVADGGEAAVVARLQVVTKVRVAAAAAAGRGVSAELFKKMLRDPANRDPRGFILPSDQPDFPTATQFVNTLIKDGVIVHRATRGVHGRRQDLSRPARTS